MTTAVIDIRDNEIVQLVPANTTSTLSDWVGDKGKYFVELLSNISFYMSQVPTFYGHGTSAAWDAAYGGFRGCKKILNFPGVFKNGITFYDHMKKGGELTRNLFGEVSYILSDAIDTIQGFASLANKALPAGLKGPLERIKDITGVFGLGNTSYNLTLDINKLRQIDVTKQTHVGLKDPKKAIEIKQRIIDAEINNKWYDRLRCVSSLALCGLGLVAAATGTIFSPWVFSMIVSVSLYGKYNMYANKTRGAYWQERYAEHLPANPMLAKNKTAKVKTC